MCQYSPNCNPNNLCFTCSILNSKEDDLKLATEQSLIISNSGRTFKLDLNNDKPKFDTFIYNLFSFLNLDMPNINPKYNGYVFHINHNNFSQKNGYIELKIIYDIILNLATDTEKLRIALANLNYIDHDKVLAPEFQRPRLQIPEIQHEQKNPQNDIVQVPFNLLFPNQNIPEPIENKNIPEPIKNQPENQTCVICEDLPKSVFIGCAHICVCDECSKKINKCPLCRKPITMRQKIILDN